MLRRYENKKGAVLVRFLMKSHYITYKFFSVTQEKSLTIKKGGLIMPNVDS